MTNRCIFKIWDIFPTKPFAVVVEPENVKDAFLTRNPWELSILNKVPWFNGLNADEGCFLVSRKSKLFNCWHADGCETHDPRMLGFASLPILFNDLNTHYERLFPILLNYGNWLNESSAKLVSASVKKYYFGDEDINSNTEKQLTKVSYFPAFKFFLVFILLTRNYPESC